MRCWILACLLAAPLWAMEIKSKDGRVIEANVEEITADGVKINRGGNRYVLGWDSLDELQANALRVMRWMKLSEDRFDGKTSLAIKEVVFSERPEMKLNAHVMLNPMKQVNEQRYHVYIDCVAPFLYWDISHEVKMLLDGERAGAIESTYYGQPVSGTPNFFERVMIDLSEPMMERICAAKKVEIRIGGTDVVLSREQHDALAAMQTFFLYAKARAIGNTVNNLGKALEAIQPKQP